MLPQITLDRTERRPLHEQLSDQLRGLVLSGTLAPGAFLPASRRAAEAWEVSRNVVVMAYEQLQLEGYLDADVGVGTWVRRSLPAHLLRPSPPPEGRDASPGAVPARLSRRGARIAEGEWAGGDADGGTGPFRPGSVAPELFPSKLWARLSSRVWRTDGERLVSYGDPRGNPLLRKQISEHVARYRAVRAEPDRILVTTGSQQALDLLVRVLVDPDEAVGLEDPGYPGARAAVLANGARAVPIPVDREGIDLADVEAEPAAARVLYTTPSHQYPLGVTLSLDRRLRLLEWARRADAWVVEDDYDSEFRYGSRPLPSLQGMDEDGRVIYVGTFSKVLAPGLRTGFLVLPPPLVDPCRSALSAMANHPPTAEQATLAEFMARGHLERHVARVRDEYDGRRRALREAIDERLGDRVDVVPGTAGLHLTVLLDPDLDDVEVARRAARHSVDVPALSRYCWGPDTRRGLLLGFGGAEPADLRRAVGVLDDAIEAVGG